MIRFIIALCVFLMGCVEEAPNMSVPQEHDDVPAICKNTLQHDIHRDICGNR